MWCLQGDEVEFFVITECVKGKMSDRAMHVRALPKGTVKFEVVLASGVTAVVVAESGSRGAEESPGIARLDTPVPASVAGDSATTVGSIELWQRCLPDELACRVGDVLQLDVHYYRPEKLYFARNVKVVRLRSLGRERGTVVALKENGFGFLHSTLRNSDAYFKSSQVLGPDSLPLADGALRVGSTVSFDVGYEETSGGGKLRAKRVMLESAAGTAADGLEEKCLIREGLSGAVVRLSTKKDSPGLIRLAPGLQQELDKVQFFDPAAVAALEEFKASSAMQSVTLFCLPLSALRSFSSVIEARFEGVAYESELASPSDPALGHNLKVFKLAEDKYAQWRADHSARAAPTVKGSRADTSAVPFYKDDYISPELGQLANDLRVRFDLYWDPSRGKRVAKRIRLTDEPTVDADGAVLGEQRGVVDVLVEKSERERFGFIRCIPSDEKLFWHRTSAAAAAPEEGAPPLMLGSEVSFHIRLRGGLRCAADIQTLPVGSLAAEEHLQHECQALVVSTTPLLLVLLDTSAVAELRRKFVDLRVVAEANGVKAETNETWGKQSLHPVATDSASGAQEAAAAGAEQKGVEGEDAALPDAAVRVEGQQGGEGFKAKYFPPLPRSSVPFQTAAGLTVRAGDVVQCRVSARWAVQRTPTAAYVTAAGLAKGVQKKGRVVRPKFRAKALAASAHVDADTLSCYALHTTDLTELADPSSEAGPLLCLAAEMQSADDHSRDLPQPGDEVEFWTVPALFPNYALLPRLLPKAKDGGVSFEFIFVSS
jgi:hypothetical protein